MLAVGIGRSEHREQNLLRQIHRRNRRRIDELRADVFVHHAQCETEIWDSIEVGSRILCNVAFTMRGAAGINVELAQ